MSDSSPVDYVIKATVDTSKAIDNLKKLNSEGKKELDGLQTSFKKLNDEMANAPEGVRKKLGTILNQIKQDQASQLKEIERLKEEAFKREYNLLVQAENATGRTNKQFNTAEINANKEKQRQILADAKAFYSEKQRLQEQAADAVGRSIAKANALEASQDAARIRALREDIIARSKKPQQPAPFSMGADKALRIGAGLSTMTGNYQAAGGMYAAANMVGMGGIELGGSTLAIGGAAVGATAAVAGLLVYGKELNKTLADMSTLYDNNAASALSFKDQISDLGKKAGELGAAFETNIIDVVKGMKEALSSGIKESELTTFMENALQLKMVLGSDLKTAISALTTTMTVYGKSVYELGHVNDVLFNIVDAGKIQVEALNGHLGKVASAAQSAGVSIEDLGTGLVALTNAGFRNGQEFTAMYRIIDGLTNPTAKAKKELDRLGIAYGENAFKGKQFADVMAEIKEKTGGSLTALGEIFDEAFAKRGAAAITNNLDKWKEWSATVNSDGSAIVAQLKIQDNLWHRIGAGIDSVTSSLKNAGSAMAEFINKATGGGKAGQQYEDMFGNSGAVAGVMNRTKGNDYSNIQTIDLSNTTTEGVTDWYKKIPKELMDAAKQQLKDSGISQTELIKVINEVIKRQKQAKLQNAYDAISGSQTGTDEAGKSLFSSGGWDFSSTNSGITPGKRLTKSLNDRMLPEQREALDDLALQREDAMAQLEDIKKQIRIEYEQGLQPLLEEKLKAENDLKEAIESQDLSRVSAMQKRLEQVVAEYNKQAELLNAQARFNPELSAGRNSVNDITNQMDALYDKILNQKTKTEVKAQEEALKTQLDAYKKYLSDVDKEHKRSIAERKKAEDLLNDIQDRRSKRRDDGTPGGTGPNFKQLEKRLPGLIDNYKSALNSGDMDRAKEIRGNIESTYDAMKSDATQRGEGERFWNNRSHSYDALIGSKMEDVTSKYTSGISDAASDPKTTQLSMIAEQFAKAIAAVNKESGAAVTNNLSISVPDAWAGLAPEIKSLVEARVTEALKKQAKDKGNKIDTPNTDTFGQGDFRRDDRTTNGSTVGSAAQLGVVRGL
jgi:TP901 family phage tail tape measure protein